MRSNTGPARHLPLPRPDHLCNACRRVWRDARRHHCIPGGRHLLRAFLGCALQTGCMPATQLLGPCPKGAGSAACSRETPVLAALLRMVRMARMARCAVVDNRCLAPRCCCLPACLPVCPGIPAVVQYLPNFFFGALLTVFGACATPRAALHASRLLSSMRALTRATAPASLLLLRPACAAPASAFPRH